MTIRKRKSRAPGASPTPSHVVCIGASAGGLDALERFFKACPKDLGVAYVVIQHLSPDHKSMMNNLLARHTTMPVVMVEDGMVLAPDSLYLIPPGAVMSVGETGCLHLTPKNLRGLTLPIDIFFSSLAERWGPRAIGVVLSGTGSDGTRGAEALKAAGGFLLAQEPETARFDGMPRSAIATGLIDDILPVEDIPQRIADHINGMPLKRAAPVPRPATAQMPGHEVLARILRLLQQAGGIDFADYKAATVMRRIERRMMATHAPELYRYLELLEDDPVELATLRREMLISVTSFFRDAEAFEALAELVISPMVESLPPDETVRVWTAGVASGEEAYSLAMLFVEAFDRHRRWPGLKIFATDADAACIDVAGIGAYPETAAAELSAERLDRFFTRKNDGYVVKNELRQSIVFARHNLLTDPPFTRMDLVVCRNTLIYFKPGAQERALHSLQYAIRDRGALMLGSSESISGNSEGMETIHPKHKLFRRTGQTLQPFLDKKAALALPVLPGIRVRRDKVHRTGDGTTLADLGIGMLLNRFAPPALIVNSQHEIVHIYGDAAAYLQQREGAASLELSRQLPEPLVPVASALLYKAEREKAPLVATEVRVRLVNGTTRGVRLSSFPLAFGEEQMTLLCFETVQDAVATGTEVNVDEETAARVALLENELAATRESLQSTIEELETSNEELQATNEELMASNEELQSSNEELQSLNEELGTVNAEFQEKMMVLSRAHADLDNMGKASGVATVFLDDQLLITRFSPDAARVFKLRPADVGRRLDDITHHLDYPDLMADIASTLATGRAVEKEVPTASGEQTYLSRILPYQIPSTPVRGVVTTFIDVTAFHDARRLQAILDALPEHIAVLDETGKILVVNEAWRRFARVNGDPGLRHTGIGVNYLAVCGGVTDTTAEKARAGIIRVLDGSLPSFTLEYPCHSPSEQRWFVMNVAPIRLTGFGAVVSHVNISAWSGIRPCPEEVSA